MKSQALLLGALVMLAAAQAGATPQTQEEALSGIAFTQRIGAAVPRAAQFVDSSGRQARLGALIGDKPAILVLAWYHCRHLCDVTLKNLGRKLKNAEYSAPRDFNVIVLSIDPGEGPAAAESARRRLRAQHGDSGIDAWHLLSGDKTAIDGLADSIGFAYRRDAETGQYAHPAGLTLLTGDGRVSSYLPGVEFDTGDLNLALTQAGNGELGSAIDRLVLRCFHFDPETGRYSVAVLKTLNMAAVATALLLAAAVGVMHWRKGRS